MRDRCAEGTALGLFDIDVNPLMIAGCIREGVDAFLVDLEPVGCSEVLADTVLEFMRGLEYAHGVQSSRCWAIRSRWKLGLPSQFSLARALLKCRWGSYSQVKPTPP